MNALLGAIFSMGGLFDNNTPERAPMVTRGKIWKGLEASPHPALGPADGLDRHQGQGEPKLTALAFLAGSADLALHGGDGPLADG